MGYSGNVIDTTAIAQNSDIQTLLTNITTLLNRLTAQRSADLDYLLRSAVAGQVGNSIADYIANSSVNIGTILGRVTAAVALDSTVAKDATVQKIFASFNHATGNVTSGVSASFSAWTQITASLGFSGQYVELTGAARNLHASSVTQLTIQLGYGGAGSEVILGEWFGSVAAAATVAFAIRAHLPIGNVRLAVRAKVDIATASEAYFGCNWEG